MKNEEINKDYNNKSQKKATRNDQENHEEIYHSQMFDSGSLNLNS